MLNEEHDGIMDKSWTFLWNGIIRWLMRAPASVIKFSQKGFAELLVNTVRLHEVIQDGLC